MDESTVHLMGPCLDAIQDCGTEIDFIVRGYASKLQVCDVGVHKPFKEYVKQEYEQFMVTREGRKAKRLGGAKWISNPWTVLGPTLYNILGVPLELKQHNMKKHL